MILPHDFGCGVKSYLASLTVSVGFSSNGKRFNASDWAYPASAQGQAMLKGIPSCPLSALHHNVAIDR